MKILVLGAGGTGGYYGGRLAQAGVDVTFLVREKRKALIQAQGLQIRSPLGDSALKPQLITHTELNATYDLVLLSCKAYDLEQAIQAIKPAVGDNTLILPILNGLPHYQRLEMDFSPSQILGGLCHIIATIGPQGEVLHMNNFASLTLGVRQGSHASMDACAAVAREFQRSELFITKLSECIEQDAWEKLTLLATLAAASCLMRGSITQIMHTDFGPHFLDALLTEIETIAQAAGYPVTAEAHAMSVAVNINPDSPATASMQRDLLQGMPVEADQILGDMVKHANRFNLAVPFLRTAYTHLQVYQNQRA